MSEPFDPYRKWLGIPPKDQPPHHYRLLGIAAFEDDPDVIENAAARQMAHLRTFQSSKHAVHSQRLLTEISAAKLCLLDPATKATYDERLREILAASGKLSSSQVLPPLAEEPPEPEAPALPRFGPRWREEGVFEPAGMTPLPVPIPMPPPVPGGPPMNAPVVVAPLMASAAAVPVGAPVGVPLIRRSTSASAMARGRRKKSSLPMVISIISLLILAGVGGIALVLANRQNLEPAPRANPAPAPTHASHPESKHKAHSSAAGETKGGELPSGPSKKIKPEDETSSFPIGKESTTDGAASAIGLPPPPPKSANSKNPHDLRDSIRQELFLAEQSLARRDGPVALEKLAHAEQLIQSRELPETAAFKSEAEELQVLARLAEKFWVKVRHNLQHQIQIGEKIGFHGHELELLAREGDVVEYRFEDATHKQPLHELPPRPALLLASKTLLAEPANLLAAAAFLAVDAKASDEERKFGRQLFGLARMSGSKDPAVARKLGLKSADEEITLDAALLPKP